MSDLNANNQIVGYQLQVDGSLEHDIHTSFEIVNGDSPHINNILSEAIVRYPEATISFVPIKQGEIQNPTFI